MTPDLAKWLQFNTEMAEIWPNITEQRDPLPNADDWNGKEGKAELVSREPGPEE